MDLRTRNILFLFFVFLFLTITPLISLYASGYKLGSGFSVEKTGILILDTKPNGAKIFINDEPEQMFWKKYIDLEASFVRTPAKIKNLLPGEYQIKMEIDGYWPWQKRLKIEPGQSTYAEDVTLFKKNLPLLAAEGNFLSAEKSDNPDYLSLASAATTSIFDIGHENITRDLSQPENSASPTQSWNSNQKIYAFGHKLYNAKNDTELMDLGDYIPAQSQAIFSKDNPSLLYFINGTSLNSFNIDSKSVTQMIDSQGIGAWLEKDRHIFFIRTTDYSTELIAWSLTDGMPDKQISLPTSDYEFVNTEQNLINLFDKKHNILYLVDPFSPIRPLKDTINNVNKFQWVNSNTLIYANDFEIWYYNLEATQKSLLTRISDRIDRIIWHPSNNYIIFSTDNRISIMELDNREKRNITDLISLDRVNDPILTADGNVLFFLGGIGNKNGLYKLFLQ